MLDSALGGRAASVRSRWLLLFGLALLALPVSGRALGIADVEPLYFAGSGGQGFSPAAAAALGLAPSFSATTSNLWLAAGASQSGSAIEISQDLDTVHQNPAQPSFASPVIADSTWTVRNASAAALSAPLLVFTSVDPLGAYPIALPATGLDADLLSLLSYSYLGDAFLYGVIPLPDLAPGASVDVTVRYVVAGALAPSGTELHLPPLGVAALASYSLVPEPSTAALLGLGFCGLAAIARTRRR